MQDELKPVAWRYDHPDHMTEYGTLRLTDGDKAAGWTETPLYAHPPTTNPVAVSETPVGDHQMVEAVADSGFAPGNIADAEWLVANMPGIRRFHDMATYERAMICHTASRFRHAALTAARAQVEGEMVGAFSLIAALLRKHDGSPSAEGDAFKIADATFKRHEHRSADNAG